MKYLNNREEFLKRSITKIDEYRKYDSFESINENDNSGPFANDIPWGDSLLGRLINATIRRAKIGANLVRIKGVARRLRDNFEELLGGAAAAKLSDEDQKEFIRFRIFTFLDNLQRAVENDANVGEIKNLTKSTIDDIEKFEDFEGKADLIDQLEKFLKFLEQFKDSEGGEPEGDKEEEGEGKEGEDKEGEDKEGEGKGEGDKKSSESLYPVMVKNLRSLELILSNYKNVKIASSAPTSQKGIEFKGHITKAGDTVDKIAADNSINLKKLTSDVIRQKNQKVLQPYPKNNQSLPAGLKIVMENMIFEAIPGTPGGSPDRGNIKSGEDHLTQAFTKLKKDIEVLISAKEKGIGIDTNFIKAITSKSVDTNTKNQIKSLYTEINRYLVGDKKATIQDKDPLYKESLEIISDKNKKVIVAEKMARFTKRALQFDKQGLYGGLGDISKPLQDYVETIKQIMQMSTSEPKNEEKPKEDVVKKESFLFRYDSFIKMVKEAEEGQEEESKDKEGEVGAPDVMTTSQKIKDYWKKNIDIKAFVMEKAEVIKMKDKFDKLEKQKEDSITINGIDPVLEIVKCFNRAYKIHTTPTIPNVGTSDGRVSAGVFAQYTSFGGGDRKNAGISGGPYRNNAIFNQWEDTVLDIMKENKYQKIFNVGTKIQVGNELIDKAGANLRKFMTDMIDGDEYYKTGKNEQGLQAKFLDKYFGYSETDTAKIQSETNFGGSDEAEQIGKVAIAMPDSVNIQFTKEPIKFESNEKLKGTFFAIKTKGDDKIYYFFIQDVVGDFAYIVYCRSFYFFDKYIRESGTKVKLSQGDLPKAISFKKVAGEGSKEAKDLQLKATKKKIDNLISKDGKFKLVGGFEIKYLTKYDGKSNNASTKAELVAEPEIIDIESCYSLFENKEKVESSKEKSRFVLSKSISTPIATNGGFPKISTIDGILKTEFKSQR